MTLSGVRRSFLTLSVCLAVSATVCGQAIMTTTGRGNQILIFPTPDQGLPSPAVQIVTGLPSGAVPHGVAYQHETQFLIADGGNSRFLIVDISVGAVQKTFDTSDIGYDGWGSVAATTQVVLAASDHDSNLYVFNTSTDNNVELILPLSGTVNRYQTDAIVFDSNGRAFVHCVKPASQAIVLAEENTANVIPSTSMAIDVFDPPYTSKAFTMTAPVEDLSGALTISNDGQTLLATTVADGTVVIFQAPFSAATVAVVRPALSGTHAFNAIIAVPGASEDTGVVVVDSAKPFSEFFKPPYATSGSEEFELPPSVTALSTGFESIASSEQLADGPTVLIATGEVQGSAAGQPAVFTVVPQGNSNPLFYAVTIPGGGRGQGCARFVPVAASGPVSRCCVDPIARPPDADVSAASGRITTPE
jgi:hypothetical protein